MTTRNLVIHTTAAIVLIFGMVGASVAYPNPNGWQLALIVALSFAMAYSFCRTMGALWWQALAMGLLIVSVYAPVAKDVIGW